MSRPSTAPIRKQVNLPPDVARKVDDYRFENRISTESEAIRRLIELGLKAVEAEVRDETGSSRS